MKEKFEFRTILQTEARQAAELEQICFPPNEACKEADMIARAAAAEDLFLIAADPVTGQIVGYLNGIATDEAEFRDEFFTDASLHTPAGRNIMLLGLCVRPAYRRQGLASEIVRRYAERESARGRERLILTCLEDKVPMYLGMGFADLGLSASTWGGVSWHEMAYLLQR